MDFSYMQQNSMTSASTAARLGDLERLRSFVTSGGQEDRAWLAVDNRGETCDMWFTMPTFLCKAGDLCTMRPPMVTRTVLSISGSWG